MNIIEHIGKYSLKDGKFSKKNLDGRSLAVVIDRLRCDESNSSYEYIILVNGNRALDITKDGIHPDGKRDYVERICNYFKRKNKNVIVEHILLDNDAPLVIEAKMIARHVDVIAQNEKINTINLIGHSKGGTILFNVPKYFENELSLEKTSITTTATPFMGCLIASPKFFIEKIKEVVYSQLPEYISKITYEALVNYYNSLRSGSHMDNDIALQGYSDDRYDPDFIARMFDILNIRAMKKVRYFQNFITGIDDYSLVDSLKRGDFTSVGLCLIDRFFMDEMTDGFIETKSQESVERYIDIKSKRLKSRTHYFLAHDDDLGIVLDTINESIDQYKENGLKLVLNRKDT